MEVNPRLWQVASSSHGVGYSIFLSDDYFLRLNMFCNRLEMYVSLVELTKLPSSFLVSVTN